MNNHSMRRSGRTLATAVMAVLLIGVMPARADQPSTSGCNDERLHTLKVKMAAARASYARGEVAKIKVTVTREIAGQETQAGAGTHVVVSAEAGEVALWGGGTTGEDGKAVVKVKVLRAAPTGPADGFGYAWREIADAPCLRAREDGHVELAKLFRITR
ncbi:MAG: hypothetical protein ACRDKB_09100 [Actinomycetota bacterium]